LVLVASAGTSASGALVPAALGAHIGFGATVCGSRGLAGTGEQDGAAARGGSRASRMRLRPGWSTCRTRASSVMVPTAVVFSPPGSFILRIIQERERGGRLVRLMNNLVEGGVGPSGQEPVQLHQQP
jgi:hypothetical protein